MEGVVIVGEVVEGRRIGRQLGFPTANIVADSNLVVDGGVYRSSVTILSSGERYRGVTNVGVNPTVGGVERRVESYILDFEGDLYGTRIEVELVEKIRDEIRFESVEQLRKQIEIDVERVMKL